MLHGTNDKTRTTVRKRITCILQTECFAFYSVAMLAAELVPEMLSLWLRQVLFVCSCFLLRSCFATESSVTFRDSSNCLTCSVAKRVFISFALWVIEWCEIDALNLFIPQFALLMVGLLFCFIRFYILIWFRIYCCSLLDAISTEYCQRFDYVAIIAPSWRHTRGNLEFQVRWKYNFQITLFHFVINHSLWKTLRQFANQNSRNMYSFVIPFAPEKYESINNKIALEI